MKDVKISANEHEKINRRLIKIQEQLQNTYDWFVKRGYDIDDLEDNRYTDNIAQIEVAIASIESYLENAYDLIDYGKK